MNRSLLLHVNTAWCAIAALGMIFPTTPLLAQPIHVGDGESRFGLVINFLLGPEVVFDVGFDDHGDVTGLDLARAVRDAGIGMTVKTKGDDDVGGFVVKIGYQDAMHSGDGDEGQNWWRYWWRNPGDDDWTFSPVGSAIRTVHDGYVDAWVYGRNGRPIVPNPDPDYVSRYADHRIYEKHFTPEIDSVTDDPRAVLGKPTTWFKTTSDKTFATSMVTPPQNRDRDGNPVVTRIGTILDSSYPYGPKVRGQSLTVAFEDPIRDDPLNPYGIDFLMFGDASFATSGVVKPSSDMGRAIISDVSTHLPPITVSVSPDGAEWYTYDHGELGRGYFPTQGFEWDPTGRRWGDALDFNRPVDPDLTPEDFEGLSVKEAINLYHGSAGGKGFDLAETGFDHIRFIRIDAVGNVGEYGTIDGFADVTAVLGGDADLNGVVDFTDFLVLQNHFEQPGDLRDGDFDGDGWVGFADFMVLQNNFGKTQLSGDQRDMVVRFSAAVQTSTVPQPGSAMALGALGVGLFGRLGGLRKRSEQKDTPGV